MRFRNYATLLVNSKPVITGEWEKEKEVPATKPIAGTLYRDSAPTAERFPTYGFTSLSRTPLPPLVKVMAQGPPPLLARSISFDDDPSNDSFGGDDACEKLTQEMLTSVLNDSDES